MISSVNPARARPRRTERGWVGELSAQAARCIRSRHGQQYHADDGDDRAGDDRREEPDEPGKERRNEEGDDAADDDGAVDRPQPGTPPSSARPMAIIGLTAAKVTPWSNGSRTPIFQNPIVWISDAIPQVNRSALMRNASRSGVSSIALASRIGTITAPA